MIDVPTRPQVATVTNYDRRMRWRVDPGDVEVIVGPDAARGQRVRLALIEGAGR